MTKNQCMTCRYKHKYPEMRFSESCGDGEPTGKMVSVCVLRNYTRIHNHFKNTNCRLHELPEGQLTIAEACK